jgi:hypothetical protein
MEFELIEKFIASFLDVGSYFPTLIIGQDLLEKLEFLLGLVVEFFQIIRIAGNSFLPISNYFKRA